MIFARLAGMKLEVISPEKTETHGYEAIGNPLGKIPVLEYQPGRHLFDSRVICEIMDLQRQRPLLLEEGHTRYMHMRQHALGDGLSDAVYNLRGEMMRPEALHWDHMIARHEATIRETVKHLDGMIYELGETWLFGNVAIICALDYAGYRASHIDWRQMAPDLAKWHAGFAKKDIYLKTYAYGEVA